jgi:hypothetical protein
MWPIERAAEVVSAYRAWTADAPEEVSTSLKLLRFPPLPDIPEPLRGRKLVAVGVSYLGDEAAGNELIAPLRDVGERHLDSMATIPASGLAFLSGDPPNPVPGRGDGVLLEALPAEAADEYVAIGGPDAEVPFTSFELRQLGGALTRSEPEHGAAESIDGAFSLYGVGMAISPDMIQAIDAAWVDIKARMAPWAAERTLLNFAETQAGTRPSFATETANRLVGIKADVDPDGIILANRRVD